MYNLWEESTISHGGIGSADEGWEVIAQIESQRCTVMCGQ